ncbi:hypothetical protein FRC04_003304 [Tulasnella sp. 424]|nr:hypothetical protein FRC04_003304 [Tulasnella sp. 424]
MLDIEEFRKAGYQAIDRICDYYYSLADKPVVAQVEPGYLRKLLPDAVPETGEPFQAIADDFQKLIMPGITHWQHPSFFAYFPTASTLEGTIADLYASTVTSPGFNWLCSPAATELEAITMDWAAKLFGLDEVFMASSLKGGGVIQPTASDSCLTAVVAARSQFSRLHPETHLQNLIIYGTTMTHSLGAKAALILGLSFRALEVSRDDAYGLRGETLRKALEEDRAAGKIPFILIATVGTTSSCAIDNISEIEEVVKAYPELWIHIDAAYAGWGLVNFESSGMWVRNRKLLTDALDVTPEFLRTKHSEEGTVIDYRNWQLALGKRFRALKLWFVLRSYGVEGFRAHIRKGIKQAELFATRIRESQKFEIVAPPSFALVVFRLLAPSSEDSPPPSLAQLNSLNRTFHSRVSARPDIFVIQTDIEGIYCLRFVPGAERTEDKHIEAAVRLFEEEATNALRDWKGEA